MNPGRPRLQGLRGLRGLRDTVAVTSARSFRFRATAALSVVVLLHLTGAVLLVTTLITASGSAVAALGLAGLVYTRGLVHAFDFDHVSMIDNSTRKLVAEGHRPASVGLAFSAGHSTVVIVTGVLLIAGAGMIRTAFDPSSPVAAALAVIGLSVSGCYLLLVAIANAAAFSAAWRLRSRLRRDPSTVVPPDALTPRGPAAAIMTVPLRRVRKPQHVYLIGMLFSLGFDTSSQIGLLIITASAGLAGTPPVALLALPFLFTAAMTLGDTLNGLMMLKLYDTAVSAPAAKLTFNLLITGVSILSALCIALLSASALLEKVGGVHLILTDVLNRIDTGYVGYGLTAFFAVLGVVTLTRQRTPSR